MAAFSESLIDLYLLQASTLNMSRKIQDFFRIHCL